MATELKADAGHVLYLYGLTESLPAASPGVPGVDQTSAVEAIQLEGVVCWISRVSSDEFEKNLNKNMENLDWLAGASVGHQRVLSTIQPQAEVLPARFGTVFRNLSSLRKHVRAGLREFQKDFKRLKNADEWGIKVFVLPSPAAKSVSPAAASGRAYLRAKAAVMPRKDSRPRTGRFFESARWRRRRNRGHRQSQQRATRPDISEIIAGQAGQPSTHGIGAAQIFRAVGGHTKNRMHRAVAAVFVRVGQSGKPRFAVSTDSGTVVFSSQSGEDPLSLVDILDHVLTQGIIIRGNLVISLAGVDLVYAGLDVILTSVETAMRHMNPPAPPAKK